MEPAELLRTLNRVRGDLLFVRAMTQSREDLKHHTQVFEDLLEEVIELIDTFDNECPDIKGAVHFLIQYKLKGFTIDPA